MTEFNQADEKCYESNVIEIFELLTYWKNNVDAEYEPIFQKIKELFVTDLDLHVNITKKSHNIKCFKDNIKRISDICLDVSETINTNLFDS